MPSRCLTLAGQPPRQPRRRPPRHRGRASPAPGQQIGHGSPPASYRNTSKSDLSSPSLRAGMDTVCTPAGKPRSRAAFWRTSARLSVAQGVGSRAYEAIPRPRRRADASQRARWQDDDECQRSISGSCVSPLTGDTCARRTGRRGTSRRAARSRGREPLDVLAPVGRRRLDVQDAPAPSRGLLDENRHRGPAARAAVRVRELAQVLDVLAAAGPLDLQPLDGAGRARLLRRDGLVEADLHREPAPLAEEEGGGGRLAEAADAQAVPEAELDEALERGVVRQAGRRGERDGRGRRVSPCSSDPSVLLRQGRCHLLFPGRGISWSGSWLGRPRLRGDR